MTRRVCVTVRWVTPMEFFKLLALAWRRERSSGDRAGKEHTSPRHDAATVPSTARALHGLGPDVFSATARAGSPKRRRPKCDARDGRAKTLEVHALHPRHCVACGGGSCGAGCRGTRAGGCRGSAGGCRCSSSGGCGGGCGGGGGGGGGYGSSGGPGGGSGSKSSSSLGGGPGGSGGKDASDMPGGLET